MVTIKLVTVTCIMAWFSCTFAASTCNSDPGVKPLSITVMPNGLHSVSCYRIPSVVKADDGTLVLFAEARVTNCDDSGKHRLAMSRSTDMGVTWGKIQFLYNDTETSLDGLNLGASVYDSRTRKVHVLFNECADKYGTPPCGPTAQLLLLSSSDSGKTWGPLRNLTSNVTAGGFAMLNPGPGTGVQTASGRLVVPAWGTSFDQPPMGDSNAVSIVSSDGGLEWRIGRPAPSTGTKHSELQAAVLYRDRLLLNVRNDASQERLISTSEDGGETWSALRATPFLRGSICQGSTVSAKGTLFFSHPFSSAHRENGWIKYSVDDGDTWWLWRQVDPDAFGYSSLTVLASNATHVTIGVVYEAQQGLAWAALTDFLPARAPDRLH